MTHSTCTGRDHRYVPSPPIVIDDHGNGYPCGALGVLALCSFLGACTVRGPYEYPADASVDGSDGAIDADDACTTAGGLIVFSTDRDGDTEIARIFADGSGFQQLTMNTWPDEQPRLSPTGDRIAWLGSPAGESELFVMNVDGSGQTSGGQALHAQWSPDGSRIAFVSYRDGDNEVYVVDADGSGLTNLTMDPATDGKPDWSPDGARIVFFSNRDLGINTFALHTMDSDGTDRSEIPGSQSNFHAPRWSPNGMLIVSARSFIAPSQYDLWKTSPVGTSQATIAPRQVSSVEWSPDGITVAFADIGAGDVFTIPGTGGSTQPLTNDGTTAIDTGPYWSPDGQSLIIQSDRDGNWEIYRMTNDGANPVNLTNDTSADTAGSWSACP